MQRTLYHYPLSPFSRKVRIFLKEKDIEFELVSENFWERRREFLAMNPAAQVPVLMEGEDSYSESTTICEYIEETNPEPVLIGSNPKDRAEVRRVAGWFNNKFYYEVTKYILDEKLFKCLRNKGEPDSGAIRAGKQNILYHLDYIGYLSREHGWLAGGRFSLADITAAAHLSALDYLGDVPWEHNKAAKEWYMLVKSRPSFRDILQDSIPGFKPSIYYRELDF